jgi:AcrR family transcriptional regulator
MFLDDSLPSSDGRRRRSEQSRDRIIAAMMSIVADGHLNPLAEDVAARAQVGLRSVFRHFKDMESLYAEMSLRLARLFQPALEPFISLDWRGKLGEMIVRRTGIYEQVLPFKRAADAHRHESPSIQANHKAMTRLLRDRLALVLPPGLAGNAQAFESIDMLLSIDCWQRLRLEQQLDAAVARRLIETQIDLIIDAN